MKMPRFILLLVLYVTLNIWAPMAQTGVEQSKRITREFTLDVAKIVSSSQKAGTDKQDHSITVQNQLELLLGAAGMTRPIQMEVDLKAGVLRVTASREELELIPSALKLISPELVLVQFDVKQIEMTAWGTLKDEYKEFLEDPSPIDSVPWQEGWLKVQSVAATNVTVEGLFRPNHMQVLSDQQHRSLIRALEQRDGVDVSSLHRYIMMTNRIIYAGMVHNYDRATVFMPGYDHTPSRIEDEAFISGGLVIVEGRVTMQPDRKTITLDWIARITQILEHDTSFETLSRPRPMDAPVPKFRVRHVIGSTQMKDGETLMVGCGRMGTPKAGKLPVVILTLTPKLLGLDGEPINK
jgi:hypothetical protein